MSWTILLNLYIYPKKKKDVFERSFIGKQIKKEDKKIKKVQYIKELITDLR